MSLETGTFISDFVITNPTDADAAQQGAAHLRLVKNFIKATFTGITGVVSATHTQLNQLASGVISAVSLTLSGALTAATGVFSGTVSAAAATASGHLVRLGQFVTGSTSLNVNNYLQLPNGVIIQWGNYGGGAISGTITYPIAFVNGPQSVTATSWGSTSYVGVGTTTSTTTFTFASNQITNFGWIAVGT